MLHSSSPHRLTKKLAKKDQQTPVNVLEKKMAAELSHSQGRVDQLHTVVSSMPLPPAPPILQTSPEDPFSTKPTTLKAKSCRVEAEQHKGIDLFSASISTETKTQMRTKQR